MNSDLREAVSEFSKAYSFSDATQVVRYVTPEFSIVTLHPQRGDVSMSAWLDGLAEYTLLDWDVYEEELAQSTVSAVHHRIAFRRALNSGAEVASTISVTDSWAYDGEHGWRVWHRYVVKLGDEPRSPRCS